MKQEKRVDIGDAACGETPSSPTNRCIPMIVTGLFRAHGASQATIVCASLARQAIRVQPPLWSEVPIEQHPDQKRRRFDAERESKSLTLQ